MLGTLVREWKQKINRAHYTNARIAALVASFGKQSVSVDDFLPFPPPPIYVTVEQANFIIQKIISEDNGKSEASNG